MWVYGVEESEYVLWEFFYLVVNNMLVSQLELCLINGVEFQWLDSLLFMVCVILSSNLMLINVNILLEDYVFLLVVLIGLSIEQVNSVISVRFQDGWDDVNDFLVEFDIIVL